MQQPHKQQRQLQGQLRLPQQQLLRPLATKQPGSSSPLMPQLTAATQQTAAAAVTLGQVLPAMACDCNLDIAPAIALLLRVCAVLYCCT